MAETQAARRVALQRAALTLVVEVVARAEGQGHGSSVETWGLGIEASHPARTA